MKQAPLRIGIAGLGRLGRQHAACLAHLTQHVQAALEAGKHVFVESPSPLT